MQYNLWFFILGLLTAPFLQMPVNRFPSIFSLFSLSRTAFQGNSISSINENGNSLLFSNTDWLNDFSVSVSEKTPSFIGFFLFGIWILGMVSAALFFMKETLRLYSIRQAALPLENSDVCKIYLQCAKELNVKRIPPVYTTVFLNSPMITGLLNPCIYLPLHLISDYREADLRYILLHELQHYKHKDGFANALMNITGIIYWFHPLVRCALKEMCNDREIACDTSVLNLLNPNEYKDYGNTLINFAEKISLHSFPFYASLGGSKKQIKQRILNIATYKKPCRPRRCKSFFIFIVTALFLMGCTPFVSLYASENNIYTWDTSKKRISHTDLSSLFGTYTGSFVLYDLNRDFWTVYNRKQALQRVAPVSTYKIYDALFALEEGIISVENSFIPWDSKIYPFDAWNKNQTLSSALASSVNWYFQKTDEQLGKIRISDYIQKIQYGNQNISGEISSYWLDSSLKISPVEQAELLSRFYSNDFHFSPENIQAVKDALLLFDSDDVSLYGKTGTSKVNGQDTAGWFIGYVEIEDSVYIFVTNIQSEKDANGSHAAQITFSALENLGIFQDCSHKL